jgi:hypothetical protein
MQTLMRRLRRVEDSLAPRPTQQDLRTLEIANQLRERQSASGNERSTSSRIATAVTDQLQRTTEYCRGLTRQTGTAAHACGYDRRRSVRTVERRLSRLANRYAPTKELILIVVRRIDYELALDSNGCLELLREGGMFQGLSGTGVVRLDRVPADLSRRQLEKYLQKNGQDGFSRPPARPLPH